MAGRKKKVAEPDPPPKEDVVDTTAPNMVPTHKFAYIGSAAFMSCICGAEQNVTTVQGMVARLYRHITGGQDQWLKTIGACAKKAGAPPPPPDPPPQHPPSAGSLGVSQSLVDALAKEYPDAFTPEIIDGCDVEKTAADVDLSIAFTPVLERRNSIDPVDVVMVGNGSYRVFCAGRAPYVVDATTLRIMRCRYLLTRQSFVRTATVMDTETRAAVERRLFPRGDVPYIAPKGSPLDAIMKGTITSPITIKREGDAPIDFAALVTTLTTPGAEVPAVCPTIDAAKEATDG